MTAARHDVDAPIPQLPPLFTSLKASKGKCVSKVHENQIHDFLLDHHFLDSLDQLLNPLLHFLLLLDLVLHRGHIPSLGTFLPYLESPGIPLVDESLSVRDQLLVGGVLAQLVFLVERTRVLLEVPSDRLLLLLVEKRAGSGSPQELLELIDDVLFKLDSAEVPDCITILDLWHESDVSKDPNMRGCVTYGVPPSTGAGSDKSSRGVPLEIGDAVVLGVGRAEELDRAAPLLLLPKLALFSVVHREVEIVEFELEVIRITHGGQHYVPPLRAPSDGVGALVGERF